LEIGSCFTIFLYYDHELAKPLINEAISIMSFTPMVQ